jgi:hypothetical protein
MARPGRDARTPPQEITAADSSSPALRARTLDFEHRLAMRLVRLAMVRDVLRSRRFYERVALAVIVIRALGQINQQNRASAMERLAAWDKRQIQRLEVKAQQQVRAAQGTRRMIRSRSSKDLQQKMRQT